MCRDSHTSCDYCWVYAYGLVAFGLVGGPVAGSEFQRVKKTCLGGLTILAMLVHPRDLVSTIPNWSQAASMLD